MQANMQAKGLSLNGKFKTLVADITAVKGSILQYSALNITPALSLLNGSPIINASSLSSILAPISNQIGSIQSAVGTIQGTIDTVQDTIDTVNSTVGGLSSNVSTINSTLSTAVQDIADLQAIGGSGSANSNFSLTSNNALNFGGQLPSYYTNTSNLTGTLPIGRLPAFTGDINTSLGNSVTTLATVNANVGSFANSTFVGSFTVNAKGLITSASNTKITPAFSDITNKPSTLSGYGITDAQPIDATLSSLSGLNWSSGSLAPIMTGVDTFVLRNVGVASNTDILDRQSADTRYTLIGAGVTGNTTNYITFDNTGSGVASGNTFNGGVAKTISYNTIGAAPIANPTFTGIVTTPQIVTTSNGLNNNIRIGDDTWIGDTNIGNTLRISGVQDSTIGYIVFGSGSNALGAIANNALTWGGSIILTASNISTYSPSLTGAGATGTWGINISGNANTATNATQLGGNTASFYAPLNNTTFTGTTNIPVLFLPKQNTTGSGGELVLGRSDTSSLVGNLAIDLSGSQLRMFDYGGTNKGAYLDISTQAASIGSKIWTTSDFNISNYLPLTGGTLSGLLTGTTLRSRDTGSVYGFLQMNHSGNATNTGLVEFYTTLGVRTGYIGYSNSTYNYLTSENSRSWNFTGSTDVFINGNAIWHSGNFNPSSYASSSSLSGYLPLTGGTLTGNLDVNTNLMLQHNGTDAYIRPTNAGSSLYLGAVNTNMMLLNTTGTHIYGSLTLNNSVGELYARVIRNTNGTSDGLWIGYGNANSGGTRIYGGGSTTQYSYIDSGSVGQFYYNNGTNQYKYWHTGDFNISNYVPLSGATLNSGAQIVAAGTTFSNDTFNGGIQLRERGYVNVTQTDNSYAPEISFHWASRFAAAIALDTNSIFSFYAQGSSRGGAATDYRPIQARQGIFYDDGGAAINIKSASTSIRFTGTNGYFDMNATGTASWFQFRNNYTTQLSFNADLSSTFFGDIYNSTGKSIYSGGNFIMSQTHLVEKQVSFGSTTRATYLYANNANMGLYDTIAGGILRFDYSNSNLYIDRPVYTNNNPLYTGTGYIQSSWHNFIVGSGIYCGASGHYFYPSSGGSGNWEWFLRGGNTATDSSLAFQRGDTGTQTGALHFSSNSVLYIRDNSNTDYQQFDRGIQRLRSYSTEGNAYHSYYTMNWASQQWAMGMAYGGANHFGLWDYTYGNWRALFVKGGSNEFYAPEGHKSAQFYGTDQGINIWGGTVAAGRYVTIRVPNTSYAYFETNQSAFYFNKPVLVEGTFSRNDCTNGGYKFGDRDGSLQLWGDSPMLSLIQTTANGGGYTAHLHLNGSTLYFLRDPTTGATGWDSGANGRHPMVMDLANGNVTFSGNVFAYSDRNLKTNITPIKNHWDLMNLNGVTFNWTVNEKHDRGFIAQEVELLRPELVSIVKDGHGIDRLTLAYDKIIPDLLEMIKDLKRQNDEQEIRLSSLESMLKT